MEGNLTRAEHEEFARRMVAENKRLEDENNRQNKRIEQLEDTVVQCVFGACGLEGGVMGWIKTTKERRQDRRWARQDAREAERAAKEMEN